MLAKRSLKIDLLALALLAASAFLAVSVWTYDPADPPSTLVFPPSDVIHNACGRVGAWAAHVLFAAVGVGAYFLIASLVVVGLLLLRQQRISQPTTRMVGWLLSLMAVASFAALALPEIGPGTAVGSGGYLGAIGRGVLEANFAHAGAYILLFATLAAGLLLSTDYLLFGATAQAAKVPLRVATSGLSQAHAAYRQSLEEKRRKPSRDEAEDEDAEDALEEDDEQEDEDFDEDDYDYDVEDEAEEDDDEQEDADFRAAVKVVNKAEQAKAAGEQGASATVGTRLASALGINSRRKAKRSVDERQQVMEEIEAASRTPDVTDYELPPLDLLIDAEPFSYEAQEREVRRKAKILEKTFASFGFTVRVVEIETGPVIAQFEIELEAGLRLSKITGLADDLAIALRVPSVRIVAPIPGKNTVGIEVPNTERQLVRMREVIDESASEIERMRIPVFLGKDVSGNPLVCDLTALPHLLIAGRTGTGKSVCLNSIIMSILMTRGPDDVRLLLIDPKMVELSCYMKLPHLMHPVVTDMKKAEAILAWAVEKMEERYALLARAGVRHVSVYNQLGEEELFERLGIEDEEQRKEIPTHLPFIVIVADEMADLMMTAAKEVEAHIIRLAQKSRAVGIHLVLATQKPTVDVITGLIKSNLPARISFQVASRTDSRVVLDEMGAEKLLGNGDMLFLWPGTSTLLRGQGAFVSDDEIVRVVDYVGTSDPQFVHELIHLPTNSDAPQAEKLKNRDELYEAAVDVIVREGRGSVSLLQRTLGIGYGRAARLIDFMAEDGIVGQYNGSQAREVLITPEQWQAMREGNSNPATAASPPVAPLIASRPKSGSYDSPQLRGASPSAAAAAKKRRTVALRPPRRALDDEPDEQLAPWEEADHGTATETYDSDGVAEEDDAALADDEHADGPEEDAYNELDEETYDEADDAWEEDEDEEEDDDVRSEHDVEDELDDEYEDAYASDDGEEDEEEEDEEYDSIGVDEEADLEDDEYDEAYDEEGEDEEEDAYDESDYEATDDDEQLPDDVAAYEEEDEDAIADDEDAPDAEDDEAFDELDDAEALDEFDEEEAELEEEDEDDYEDQRSYAGRT